jgi:hypothetical protein
MVSGQADSVFGVVLAFDDRLVGLLAARLRRFVASGGAPAGLGVAPPRSPSLPLAARSPGNTAPLHLRRACRQPPVGEGTPRARLAGAAVKRKQPSPDKPRLNLALLAGASVPLAITVAMFHASNEQGLGWASDPLDGALAAIRACEGPLSYNQYGDGGTLDPGLAPEKPVLVDGRQDP